MVGVTFCVVEFLYFGVCKVPCTEGLWSGAVYWGLPKVRINLGLEI